MSSPWNDLSHSIQSQTRGGKASSKKLSKTPHVMISESLESVKKVIELDTDSSLTDLSLLEKLNNDAIVRYRSLGETVSQLEATTIATEENYLQVSEMGPKIEKLEAQIDKLLAVASEIDEWSRELEVKAKRYRK